MLTKVKLNGAVILTREDEHGNFWIYDCPETREGLGMSPKNSATGHHGTMIFGCCIVGPNGCSREAREHSINYYTVEAGAEIVWLEKVLEPHEVMENVRKWLAKKSFQRMRTMNVVLPSGFTA